MDRNLHRSDNIQRNMLSHFQDKSHNKACKLADRILDLLLPYLRWSHTRLVDLWQRDILVPCEQLLRCSGLKRDLRADAHHPYLRLLPDDPVGSHLLFVALHPVHPLCRIHRPAYKPTFQ